MKGKTINGKINGALIDLMKTNPSEHLEKIIEQLSQDDNERVIQRLETQINKQKI